MFSLTRGRSVAAAFACALVNMPAPTLANSTEFKPDLLTGLPRLACEAILCLSSSVRPSECAPSLAHYFGINLKTWADTVRARRNFLQMCPASKEPGMPDLISAISSGAGRCDAAMLNQRNRRTAYRIRKDYLNYETGAAQYVTQFEAIDDVKPLYCLVYENNEYTADLGTKYVGDPFKGGFWVEAKDYEQALKKWLAKQQNTDNDAYSYSWNHPLGYSEY